jgi:hypothetical protein
MRVFLLSLFLCLAVLFPKTGNAQVSQFRIPQPEVTASNADWQVNSSPILVGGVIYYPTRGFREFDGQVMAEVDVFEGVPIYADTTLEPYSELYVPVGGTRMRAYERRRDGALASTSASRVPSFPIIVRTEPAPGQRIDETAAAVGGDRRVGYGASPDTTRGAGAAFVVNTADRPGGSAAAYDPRPTPAVSATNTADRTATTRTMMQSIARPSTNNGIWLEFDNARWYAVGPATAFSPDRFEPLGEYRGFPVYRDKTRTDGAIWVSVFKDSPAVAPYAKR